MPAQAMLALLLVALSVGSPLAQPATPVLEVHFDYYAKDRTRLHALEHRLDEAIRRAGAGELGETELHLDGNDGYLYLYGPDPDRLYGVVSAILKSSRLMAGAEVTERRGDRSQTFTLRRGR